MARKPITKRAPMAHRTMWSDFAGADKVLLGDSKPIQIGPLKGYGEAGFFDENRDAVASLLPKIRESKQMNAVLQSVRRTQSRTTSGRK